MPLVMCPPAMTERRKSRPAVPPVGEVGWLEFRVSLMKDFGSVARTHERRTLWRIVSPIGRLCRRSSRHRNSICLCIVLSDRKGGSIPVTHKHVLPPRSPMGGYMGTWATRTKCTEFLQHCTKSLIGKNGGRRIGKERSLIGLNVDALASRVVEMCLDDI